MNQSGIAFQGIINGIMGDQLAISENPLSIKMGLCDHQGMLDLKQSLKEQYHGRLSNKLAILLHGLTNTEAVWRFKQAAETGPDDYGRRLQKDQSFTPFYLRYNSGLNIHDNAARFSRLMEQLVAQYPIEVEDIVLIGYSMGGLIARIAQLRKETSWQQKLSTCIYLGTPHEGAPLERLGALTSRFFGFFPQPYLNHWTQWIDTRSEGIKNLHSGLAKPSVSAEEHGFYENAQHCFVSGGLFEQQKKFADSLIGDSLVQRRSASPASAPENSHSVHFEKLDHISLAHSNRVYQQIERWLLEYALPAKDTRFFDLHNAQTRSTGSLPIKDMKLGSAQVALDLYDRTLDTVELMHHSISEEPYSILKRIPVTKTGSHLIQKTHHGVANTIYKMLRFPSQHLRQRLPKQKS